MSLTCLHGGQCCGSSCPEATPLSPLPIPDSMCVPPACQTTRPEAGDIWIRTMRYQLLGMSVDLSAREKLANAKCEHDTPMKTARKMDRNFVKTKRILFGFIKVDALVS